VTKNKYFPQNNAETKTLKMPVQETIFCTITKVARKTEQRKKFDEQKTKHIVFTLFVPTKV